MLIPPHYQLTSTLSQLLSTIEANSQVINSITIPPEVETNIRRQSTLKSSLFSARIEGNNLTLKDLESPSRTQKKLEVSNLLKAYNYQASNKKDLTLNDLLSYHKIALDGLTDTPGHFRTNHEAIFNSAGIAIYMPPPPRLIIANLSKLLKYLNSGKEPLIVIKACLGHYIFEKIHPFLDGNGRVGRLFLQRILNRQGYGFKHLVSLEEYLDTHRSEYYRALDTPERDVTDYLEFMLQAIAHTTTEAKNLVIQKQTADFLDYLLPRRAEIYQIVKDHKLIDFESLHRRFLTINPRTLRYDLKKLQDSGLIRKRGTTRGVYYEIAKS